MILIPTITLFICGILVAQIYKLPKPIAVIVYLLIFFMSVLVGNFFASRDSVLLAFPTALLPLWGGFLVGDAVNE